MSSAADAQVLYANDTTIISISTGGVVQADTATAFVNDAATRVAARTTARGLPTLGHNDFEVIAYNHFGGTVSPPALSALTAITAADGKSFTMTLAAVTENTTNPALNITRVLVLIPKHAVELADPRAELDDDGDRKPEGKSAAASIVIHFVGPDADDPMVNSIRRADDPLLPVTSETVNVIIVLSEQPKEFTKDHVERLKRDTLLRSCRFSSDTFKMKMVLIINSGNDR